MSHSVPNPLLQYTHRGALTLLDKEDLAVLRGQTIRPCAQKLPVEDGETPEQFYDKFHKILPIDDDIEARCTFKYENVMCQMHMSWNDLQSFGSTAAELELPSACVSHPFLDDDHPDKDLPGLVLFATMQFQTNAFGLHLNALHAGCTLARDFLAMRADMMGPQAQQELVLAQFTHLAMSDPNQLLYQAAFATSKTPDDNIKRQLLVERAQTAELDKDTEVRRLQQIAFMHEISLYRGCEQHIMPPPPNDVSPSRVYWVVPEVHGLGQVIKQEKEELFSHARIFAKTLDRSAGVYLHVPDAAFQKAVKSVLDTQKRIAAPTDWNKLAVYVTHRLPGAPAVPTPLAFLDPEMAAHKFCVVIRLDLIVMRPKLTPLLDVFLSSTGAAGRWAPGLKYFDPLLATYKEGDEKKQEVAIRAINPLAIHEYLSQYDRKRIETKAGNGPRKDVPYVNLLLEEI